MVYLLLYLVPLLEAVEIGLSGDLRVWKIEFLINLLNPTILNVYDYLYGDPAFGRGILWTSEQNTLRARARF